MFANLFNKEFYNGGRTLEVEQQKTECPNVEQQTTY
jgi:hypothetical protein